MSDKNSACPETARTSPVDRRLSRLARLAAISALASSVAACGGGGGGGTPPPPPPAPTPTPIAISSASALWVSEGTIAWPGAAAGHTYKLFASSTAKLAVDSSGAVSGSDASIDLAAPAALDSADAARFPQLSGAIGLALPASALAQVPQLLKEQLVVVDYVNGKAVKATQPQLQGVLDDVYAGTAGSQALGVSFAADHTPTYRLWAPTATDVQVTIDGTAHAMSYDAASGTWSWTGNASEWNTAYYTYQVTVYSHVDGDAVHTYTVTDPYAVTLDADIAGQQQHAMTADLDSAAMKPAGWDTQAMPPQVAATDEVLYELHIRDFSANDPTVPAAHRGKYLAFADAGTDGNAELARLAAAGVTHVHLLPAFDIASIDEGGCTTPTITNTDPIGQGPAGIQASTHGTDCFNWGYDPKHYGAPEGTYATDAAHGDVRVREFRQMVQSLHAAGLQVVMDVVYNHMSSNYLDQIVPGYYYRLDATGKIENTSCCSDMAPEFAMTEKLMTDTLVRWAVEYKVDGFRFDIMSDIPLAVMKRAKAAVDAAIGASRKAYWYGEGWNNGTDRFVPADQAHLAGSGIGAFDDRIRDSVRGGGPFDGGSTLVSNHGLLQGACFDGSVGSATACDWIRVGMAGAVTGVPIGSTTSDQVDYYGQHAAWASNPQETVNYVGVHDGMTLYDVSQFKHAASVSSADRARAQVVGLGTVILSQGVPFIHAGDELLRSKGFDANSYDSGDWFNRIDWSATTDYIGVMGLPPSADNSGNWSTITSTLEPTAGTLNVNVVPTATDIAATRDAVLDLLKVRRSSTLFHLPTGDQVRQCVSFPDASAPVAGVVVMRLGADGVSCGDGTYANALVVVNGTAAATTVSVPGLSGHAMALHPVLAAGSDPVVKTATGGSTGVFGVPARTVAVFVQ